MTKSSLHFSYNSDFWFQIKSQLIIFGLKGTPNNVHFTISYNEKSDDINFHITKNSTDPKDKPQIKIIIINKKLFNEVLPPLLIKFLNRILVLFEVEKFKKKYGNELYFISYDSLQKPEIYSKIEQQLSIHFNDILKRKNNNHYKINGNIEECFEALINSKNFKDSIIDSEYNLFEKFNNQTKNGIIITNDNAVFVFFINNKWYTLNTNLSFFHILATSLNQKLAQQITWKTKRALIAIKDAKKYSDTSHLSDPIRLIKNEIK